MTSYNIVGLSFYPWWQGTLDELEDNIPRMKQTFGKKVAIMETGYPWTLEVNDVYDNNFVKSKSQLHHGYDATKNGQKDFIRDVRQVAERTGTLGVLYWAPTGSVFATMVPCGKMWLSLTLTARNSQVLQKWESLYHLVAAAGAALPWNSPPPPRPATDLMAPCLTSMP